MIQQHHRRLYKFFANERYDNTDAPDDDKYCARVVPLLVQKAFGDAFVGVDAAVAEKRPMLAGYFDEFGVEVGD